MRDISASMIEVKQVHHYYGRFHSLRGLNFQVPRGSITGFIGANGAGKSTTLKCLSGFLVPSSGDIIVDGLVYRDNPFTIRAKVGYMPETPLLYPEMRVTEYLDYVGKLKGLPKSVRRATVEQLTPKCGLAKIHRKLVGSLSKGNRQRVALAQALLGGPAVLLLDEPTAALDPAQVIEIRQFIRELGATTTVLMTSHILSEIAQICNHLVFIRDGLIQYQGAVHGAGAQATNGVSQVLVRFREWDAVWSSCLSTIPGARMLTSQHREVVYRVEQEELFFPLLFQTIADQQLPVREIVSGEHKLESLFS